MKNTNLNQFMMLLMLSVTSAGAIARPAMIVDETRYGTLPIGLETDYNIEEVDNGPRYIITEQDTPHYREEAAPVDFTVEAPSVMKVGENPEAPLMGQIDLAMAKLKNMKREEDAKDLSEVVYKLEMANHKIQSLPILESNKKAYDREVIVAERELRAAEHEYRKATHGRNAAK
jgi:hypothetical protein